MAELSNQNPEQRARNEIDEQLRRAAWRLQSRRELDLNAARGVAVREYPTDVGPMDYALFADGEPCGVIEAKREEDGQRLTAVEWQTESYAIAGLRHVGQADMRFRYEATGKVTYFTDAADPDPPLARGVRNFRDSNQLLLSSLIGSRIRLLSPRISRPHDSVPVRRP